MNKTKTYELIAEYKCIKCHHIYKVSYVSGNPIPGKRRLCEKCKDENYTALWIRNMSRGKYRMPKNK